MAVVTGEVKIVIFLSLKSLAMNWKGTVRAEWPAEKTNCPIITQVGSDVKTIDLPAGRQACRARPCRI